MSRKQRVRYLCPVCGTVTRHRYCGQHAPNGWQTEHKDRYADRADQTTTTRGARP